MNAIETEQLTRSFESLVAVDHLTLSIPTGSVFGFLGPNGAGKTTTLILLVVGIVLFRIAIGIFQRESILTRWK
jgi:ABC-type multidrug transport system ATPase subunit